MNNNELHWVAGLFEGEGTFHISQGRAISIGLTSTDMDVLQRLQSLAGGQIYHIAKRKSHWKESWIWRMPRDESVALVEQLLPLLGERRRVRGGEYLRLASKRSESLRSVKARRFREQVRRLRHDEGLTHAEIAKELGVGRPYVSHILGSRYADADKGVMAQV